MARMSGIECVLLDIEGTVCPISFVKDTLFPYALRALPTVLATQWTSPALEPYIAAFPAEHRSSPESLETHVADLTARDVKDPALKNLQGYLWEEGYRTGAYATPLFPDVKPALKRWTEEKSKGSDLDHVRQVVAIYSSGSVWAQKLFFEHVGRDVGVVDDNDQGAVGSGMIPSRKREREIVGDDYDDANGTEKRPKVSAPAVERNAEDDEPSSISSSDQDKEVNGRKEVANEKSAPHKTEDLRDLVRAWFDTTNAGPKLNAESYVRIAKDLKLDAGKILFLSDNVKEIDAAAASGMKAILVDRPGNAPLSDDDRSRLLPITSFEQIDAVDNTSDQTSILDDEPRTDVGKEV